MTVYTLDPLGDPRWAQLVSSHPSASVFHTIPWLQAIQRTYGYTPVVYTTCPPSAPLSNGIVLCQIRSWLTGRRMVSLPFSDHCDPLLDGTDSALAIGESLRRSVKEGTWKFVELRATEDVQLGDGTQKSPAAFLHRLSLAQSVDEIFRHTHKTSIQQRIRRAERERLHCECGTSEELLRVFYRLMTQTRRRHCLPPQPLEWFRTLIALMGDHLRIRVAFQNGRAAAALLTLTHQRTVVYKYSASDESHQKLGGTAFLLWNTILEAKASGQTSLDFGRSDAANKGLIAFKNYWGAAPSELNYLRWSSKPRATAAAEERPAILRHLIAVMPDAVLQTTGRLLYRHVG